MGVSFLALHPGMTPLKVKTWFFLIGAFIAFALGYAMVRMVWFTYNPRFKATLPAQPAEYSWRAHYAGSFAVLAFYSVGVAVYIYYVGGLAVFSKDVHLIMNRNFNLGLWSYVYASYPAVIVLFGVGAFKALNPHKRLRTFSKIVVVVVLILATLTFPSRGLLMKSIAVLVIMYNFLSKRIKPTLILLSVVAAIGLFILIAFARNQFGTDVEGIAIKKVLTLPYLYFANNFWNLDFAINPPTDFEIHPFTYGMDFFNGLTQISPVGYQLVQSYNWDNLFNDRIQKVAGLNTIVYLWEFYKDWGLFGVIFFPALLGAFIGFLYHKMLATWQPRVIIFYAWILFFVAWSFMVESYKSGLMWLCTILALLVTQAAKHSGRKSIP